MDCTSVFSKTLNAYKDGYRIISNCGGARSSKTFSTLQLLYLIAIAEPNVLISIVAEVYPVLKRGCMNDLKKILQKEGNAGVQHWNKTNATIYFSNGSRIEFFSADNPSKSLGSQRDYLFLNESNHIAKEIIDQLMIRTSKVVFIDYNPSNSWYIDELRTRNDFVEIHSTYKDNSFLTEEQIKEIEAKKNNKRFWTVYGLGLFAAGDSVVFPEFSIIDDFNFENPTYGMDWGYIDPTTLVKVQIQGNSIFLDEVLYKSRLSADEVIKYLTDIKKNETIIADNAEPQIIHYIAKKGFNIKPCIKGKNSIMEGIKMIQDYKLCVTKRSLNLINELRNYCYDTDLNGNYIEKPIDGYNHCIDAIRYAVTYLKNNENKGKYFLK